MTAQATGLFDCDIRGAGFTDREAARIYAAQPAVKWASALVAMAPWHINGTIWVESRFNPSAVSSAGAIGLMQLMTATARAIAKSIGLQTVDFFNPKINVQLGSMYLKHQVMWAFKVTRAETFTERAYVHRRIVEALGFEPTDWQLAYGAYFAGRGGIEDPGLRKKNIAYIRAVESAVARFKALESYCEGKPAWMAPAPEPVTPHRPRPTTPTPIYPTQPAPMAAAGGGAAIVALLFFLAMGEGEDFAWL